MDTSGPEFARLEERVTGIKGQLDRLVAHVDSEQRVYTNHGKRIDVLDRSIDRMQTEIDKHDKILLNSGAGIVLKMDRIIQSEERRNTRFNSANLLSAIAILISLIEAYVIYTKT